MKNYVKSEEMFEYLMSTFTETIKGWDYFVKWSKVFENVESIEIQLNLLNYLVGKENIEEEFKALVTKYPEIMVAIPILVASRDKSFDILNIIEDDSIKFELERYDFSKKKMITSEDVERAVEFARNTGALDIIKDKKIKNLVDYVTGVEVGLDSNGRKNRSGTAMESLVERFIAKLCRENNFEYTNQATAKAIKEKWGIEVKLDKAERRFDFAVKTDKQLYLFECNYYSGGGSKLKATAGEFKAVQDIIKENGFEFIWVTDGMGWHTSKRFLNETFNHNDYILNLKMMQDGMLEELVK